MSPGRAKEVSAGQVCFTVRERKACLHRGTPSSSSHLTPSLLVMAYPSQSCEPAWSEDSDSPVQCAHSLHRCAHPAGQHCLHRDCPVPSCISSIPLSSKVLRAPSYYNQAFNKLLLKAGKDQREREEISCKENTKRQNKQNPAGGKKAKAGVKKYRGGRIPTKG